MRCGTRYLVFSTVICSFFLISIIYESTTFDNSVVLLNANWQGIIENRQREVNESIGCTEFLKTLQNSLTVQALLIDSTILELVGKSKCETLNGWKGRVKVATNSRKDFLAIDEQVFEPIYFKNDETKDYLEFETEPVRIIPKNFETIQFGRLVVPQKPWRFREFWKNSQFINCRNITMNRNETVEKKLNPIPASFELSRLRDLLVEYDMFPMMSEGTLLGWYRECSIIPHTNDIDLNIVAEEFNPKFVEDMRNGKTAFKMNRKLGKLEDALEFTVSPREGYKVFTDIFLMYIARNESSKRNYNWIGSLCPDGEKFRITLPLFYPLCAADLHGHLMWTVCDPLTTVEYEFGDKWYVDLPSKQYRWQSTPKNVKSAGWYSRWELRRVWFEDGYG